MIEARARGGTLELVAAVRSPKTGRHRKTVLYVLRTRAEAEAVLETEPQGRGEIFRMLLELAWPQVVIDWEALRAAIRERLPKLAESAETSGVSAARSFREELDRVFRRVACADPTLPCSGFDLIEDHHETLVELRDLLNDRLQALDRGLHTWRPEEPSATTRDPFGWRHALQPALPPPDIEEGVGGLHESGKTFVAERRLRVLTRCFELYGEGHNMLGLIALERRDREPAIEHFQTAVELGRQSFPDSEDARPVWTNLDARTYLRALKNLALTQLEDQRFGDCLKTCRRLERDDEDGGDGVTTTAVRAAVALNRGQWSRARALAETVAALDPLSSLLSSFASHAMGQWREAGQGLLHACLNQPRAVRVILGFKDSAPKTYDEAAEFQRGMHERRCLQTFLGRWPRSSRAQYREIVDSAAVRELIRKRRELLERSRAWPERGDPEVSIEEFYDSASREFAEQQAAQLSLFEPPPAAP